MADDKHLRPFPPNDGYGRPAPAPGHAPAAGGDPLAELARLIGQSDPFSEFGRDGTRRAAAAPTQAAPPVEWGTQPAHTAYPAPPTAPDPRAPVAAPYGNSDSYDGQMPAPEPQPFGAPAFDRAPFGAMQFSGNADPNAGGYDEPAYAGAPQDGGYEQDHYYQQQKVGLTPEGEDYYDDEPRPRRRFSVMAIAAVCALAVLGTAGAFGYRALFGASGSTQPPPVIKADTSPSKIVTASAANRQSGKSIQDRVGSGEKLVSREEAPLEVQDKASRVIFPATGASNMVQAGGAPPMANGSGIIVGEPKKIRTITIRPDQPVVAEPATAPKASTAARAAPPPARIASAPAADEPPPVRQAAPARTPAPVVSGNAPLSLSPTGTAQAAPVARASAPPVRPAAAPPGPTPITPQLASANSGSASNGGNGSYAVQLSSQRSEAEAQASFRSIQGRFTNLLGNRSPIIRRVDLGAKGVYYRAMVGPFGNSNEASELCSSLKSAGGDCIVHRN